MHDDRIPRCAYCAEPLVYSVETHVLGRRYCSHECAALGECNFYSGRPRRHSRRTLRRTGQGAKSERKP